MSDTLFPDMDSPRRKRNGNGQAARPASVVQMLSVYRAASDLIARSQYAAMAGITFGTKRDLYTTLGYPRLLTPKDYRERYERGDLAARVVEAYPHATWRGGAELVEDEDPDTVTAFEEAFDELEERLQVWSVLGRADVLCGLGPYSVVLIGAPGALESELPRFSGPDGVLYLAPYGPEEVSVDLWEENVEDPRYGLPLFYKIRRRTALVSSVDRRVHWTRVVHVADNLLDDRVNGRPLIGRVWNRLDDLDKVVGGGSEAFWARVHRGMALKLSEDPGFKYDAAAKAKVEEQLDEYLHGMRRYLTTRGIDIQELGGDVSNFGPQVNAIVSLISGATGIPQRILLGSERGELASSQDKENWNERVRDRRETFGTAITRDLVDSLVDHGALPEPEEYDVRWPDIDDLTETERANVADKWSGLNTKAKGTVVTAEEIRDRVLRLPKLEPSQLEPTPTEDQLVEEQTRVAPAPPEDGTEQVPPEEPPE